MKYRSVRDSWICSNCNEPLAQAGGSLVCVNGHMFDVAKAGYTNFLVGRKLRHEGDTAEMLLARRRFFDAGHYEPLRKRLIEIVKEFDPRVVLEVGCGEGYYIGGVSEHINSSVCLGTDIAKEAVRMGASRYTEVGFAVADTNQKLPLPDRSVDVIMDIFAPRNIPEFARIIARSGRLIVVIPTSLHLIELRDSYSLLGIQSDKRRVLEEGMGECFKLTSDELVSVPLKLKGTEILDIISMTPSARFLNEATKEKLRLAAEVEVTGEFEILIFEPL